MLFRSRVQTLGADPNYSSEIVLAYLLLAEQYQSKPTIVPIPETVTEVRSDTDATLIINTSVPEESENDRSLDLIDVWQDVYELPYVFAVCVCYEESFSDEELQLFSKVGNTVQQILSDYSKRDEFDNLEFSQMKNNHEYCLNFTYSFGEYELEALKEFYRLAYYYGLIADIPEIREYHPLGHSFSIN